MVSVTATFLKGEEFVEAGSPTCGLRRTNLPYLMVTLMTTKYHIPRLRVNVTRCRNREGFWSTKMHKSQPFCAASYYGVDCLIVGGRTLGYQIWAWKCRKPIFPLDFSCTTNRRCLNLANWIQNDKTTAESLNFKFFPCPSLFRCAFPQKTNGTCQMQFTLEASVYIKSLFNSSSCPTRFTNHHSLREFSHSKHARSH